MYHLLKTNKQKQTLAPPQKALQHKNNVFSTTVFSYNTLNLPCKQHIGQSFFEQNENKIEGEEKQRK